MILNFKQGENMTISTLELIENIYIACGKEFPAIESNEHEAIGLLAEIIDQYDHNLDDPEELDNDEMLSLKEWQEEMQAHYSDLFEAIEELENNNKDDYYFEFDGNEYRIIKDGAIWEIYAEEIEELVKDCYSDVLNFDKTPSFIAVSVDWEQTVKNAHADGYGHHFSSYDGSENNYKDNWIFRTN